MLFEYDENKILATLSNDVFLIHDFYLVQHIDNQTYHDGIKSDLFALPGFDITDFPFIICTGMKCISLFNVKEGSSNPLIYDITNPGFQGISTCFAKQEEYGLSIHWSNVVPNVEGNF